MNRNISSYQWQKDMLSTSLKQTESIRKAETSIKSKDFSYPYIRKLHQNPFTRFWVTVQMAQKTGPPKHCGSPQISWNGNALVLEFQIDISHRRVRIKVRIRGRVRVRIRVRVGVRIWVICGAIHWSEVYKHKHLPSHPKKTEKQTKIKTASLSLSKLS